MSELGTEAIVKKNKIIKKGSVVLSPDPTSVKNSAKKIKGNKLKINNTILAMYKKYRTAHYLSAILLMNNIFKRQDISQDYSRNPYTIYNVRFHCI